MNVRECARSRADRRGTRAPRRAPDVARRSSEQRRYFGRAHPRPPGTVGRPRLPTRAVGGAPGRIRALGVCGVVKECWFLQETPNGDLFVAYLERPVEVRALGRFAASRAAFDAWFTRRLAGATGVDLSTAPGPLSELVSRYEAAA